MIKWSPQFETGLPELDADHRNIIRQLNALEDSLGNRAPNEQIRRLLAFLDDYLRRHFEQEEKRVSCYVCPARERNKEEHRQFIEKLDRWLDRINLATDAQLTELVGLVQHEIATWIVQHIGATDCKFKEAVSAAGTTSPVSKGRSRKPA